MRNLGNCRSKSNRPLARPVRNVSEELQDSIRELLALLIDRDASDPTCRIPQFQFSERKTFLDILKSVKKAMWMQYNRLQN